jgi:hypothetical protein
MILWERRYDFFAVNAYSRWIWRRPLLGTVVESSHSLQNRCRHDGDPSTENGLALTDSGNSNSPRPNRRFLTWMHYIEVSGPTYSAFKIAAAESQEGQGIGDFIV